MELIRSTIAPDSWDELGGRGAIQPFPNGVYVDAQGVLRRSLEARKAAPRRFAQRVAVADAPTRRAGRANTDPRRYAPRRWVSLLGLERAVAKTLARGRGVDETMLTLAGLERVEQVCLVPETGDVLLAGPAGDWTTDADHRVVSSATGRPVVRLDDLVTLLRKYTLDAATPLGCSINPRQDRLAHLQAFLSATSSRPLKAGERGKWLETLRRRVGPQDIEFFGVDPTSRVAQVLIEADYHMKLVGIGLAPAPRPMKGYLESIEVAPGQAPPPLDVLRWWFTLDENALAASADGLRFDLRGDGVRVRSENEHLTALGQRVATGAAEPLNRDFANSFTAHFAELADLYPVYAELSNVFQLALAATIVASPHGRRAVDWDLGCFAPEGDYRTPRATVAQTVDSVANVRVVRRRQVLAVVSGGVRAETLPVLVAARSAPSADSRPAPRFAAPESGRWWWDSP